MAKADCGVSVDAIETWLKDKHTPRRQQMLAMLDTFFPVPVDGCTQQNPDLQAMNDAWTAEQRPQKKRSRLPEPPDYIPESAADWPRQNPEPLMGLAELELHTPHADNEGGHRLRGRLVVGAREDDTNDQPILLSMREAFLRVETPNGMESDGSLIGVREQHEYLKAAPGGLRVVGPQTVAIMPDGREHKYLDGDVFKGVHLAVLKTSEENEPLGEVSVTLSVMRRHFDVTPLNADGENSIEAVGSEAKHAILNMLIFGQMSCDEQGRAIVQKATLRRRAKR